MAIAALWAGAYLLGGIPVGWLVGRAAGVDLRRVGTGKIGTSNLFHTVGLLPAAVVGPLQFGQGLLPVVAAELLHAAPWVIAGAGLMAVIGNGWPFYFRYNGGRGVATATGAVALWSWIGLGFVLLLLAVSGLARRSGLGVLLAYLGLPLVLWWSGAPTALAVTGIGVVICLLLRRFEGYALWPRSGTATGDSFRRRLIDDWRPGPGPADPDPQVNSQT
ncbi:MAG: glycerol-3-phosphate acyltransferase [Candidatus Dormibacteria bacterium]